MRIILRVFAVAARTLKTVRMDRLDFAGMAAWVVGVADSRLLVACEGPEAGCDPQAARGLKFGTGLLRRSGGCGPTQTISKRSVPERLAR